MRRTKPILLPTEVVEKTDKRVTAYNKGMASRILHLAQLGLIQKDIARALQISTKTLENWLRDRDDCRKAYDQGKFVHDHGVQGKLLERAMGFEYEESKTVIGVDSIGRPYEHTTTRMVKVLGDTTAQIFWLKNRDPGSWSDTKQLQINSNIDVNLNNTLKLDTLSDQEREMVQAIALKQLSGTSGLKK